MRVPELLRDRVCDCDWLRVPVRLGVPERVPVRVAETLGVALGVALLVPEDVVLGVGAADALLDDVGAPEGLPLGVAAELGV